jgi:hypothetical protein
VKYSSFTKPAILLDNADGETFTLYEGFEYRLGSLENDIIISVPKGFVTDLGSIPAIVSLIIPKLGKYNQSCILHDYLYDMVRKDKFSRVIADSILLEAMEVLEVPFLKRWIIYLGVRCFGFWAARKMKG